MDHIKIYRFLFKFVIKFFSFCPFLHKNRLFSKLTAGEFMSAAQKFLQQNMHPILIISAYRQALDDMQEILDEIRFFLIYFQIL